MVVFDSFDNPKIVALLKNGAVGVIPTDTVYGLAVCADNPQAVQRLYNLKDRKQGKPGTVIAADIAQLARLGMDEATLSQVAPFWPNPLSIVISVAPHLDYLALGLPDVAVRIPNDSIIHDLLAQTGPLLTSSANNPGSPPATNMAQAQQIFKDKVDFYVDGGDLHGRLPSTVAVLREGALVVTRPGAVTINSEREVSK